MNSGIHMAQAFLGARPIFSLLSSTLPGYLVPVPRSGPSGGALQESARTWRLGTGLGVCLCGDVCMAVSLPETTAPRRSLPRRFWMVVLTCQAWGALCLPGSHCTRAGVILMGRRWVPRRSSFCSGETETSQMSQTFLVLILKVTSSVTFLEKRRADLTRPFLVMTFEKS